MKPILTFALFAALLCMPSCSDYEGDPGPDPGSGLFCLIHSHCFEMERCINNRCRANPPPCGEDVAPDCAWGLEEDECHQSGGSIECSPLDPTWCYCDCPTGQAGCPCWSAAHCRGDCVAAKEILSSGECENLKLGVCTARTTNLGCFCAIWFFGGGDSFSLACAD